MPAVVAVLVLVAGLVGGTWLMTSDHFVVGLVLLLVSVPLAIASWLLVGDRRG